MARLVKKTMLRGLRRQLTCYCGKQFRTPKTLAHHQRLTHGMTDAEWRANNDPSIE